MDENNKQKIRQAEVTQRLQASRTEFDEVYGIIVTHRNQACADVNHEHLLMCWEIGEYISAKIKDGKWGDSILEQLRDYITRKNPGVRGFGKSNLYNMVKFYETYSAPIFQQTANQLGLPQIFQSLIGKSEDNFQLPIGKFPNVLILTTYTNHIDIMNRCRSVEERIFYMLYCYRENLQSRELKRCIKNDTFGSLLGGSKSNMNKVLKQSYPDAIHLLKDRIFVEFLGLPRKHTEPQMHKAIIEHMKDFILELGKDFILMGSEYPLKVGGDTFHVDMLFYHRALQCMVAVELKSKTYKPKDKGQLEFYLEVIDRDIKRSNENPTIGMLLCPDADDTVVEYSLNRSMSPMMIAKYEQTLIPKDVLRNALVEFVDFIEKNS